LCTLAVHASKGIFNSHCPFCVVETWCFWVIWYSSPSKAWIRWVCSPSTSLISTPNWALPAVLPIYQVIPWWDWCLCCCSSRTLYWLVGTIPHLHSSTTHRQLLFMMQFLYLQISILHQGGLLEYLHNKSFLLTWRAFQSFGCERSSSSKKFPPEAPVPSTRFSKFALPSSTLFDTHHEKQQQPWFW
jgi:hypothetical protein